MPTSDPLITALDNLAKSNKDSAQAIADSLKDVASALRSLGNGNQHAPGAIEFVGMALRDGLSSISSALQERE
jgi:hypothetical protein